MRKLHNPAKAKIFTILGIIFVVFAVIGMFVPLWPRTPFAIVASIFFAKANPRLHAWLLNSRLLGPYLQNYYYKTGLTMGYKVRTCVFMWVGLVVSLVIIDIWWLYILLGIKGIIVSIHIFKAKTKKHLQMQ